MDDVQGANGFSGYCPVRLDFVQGISKYCPHFPLSPWTLSRESTDIAQGDCGQCPLSPLTLSSVSGLPGLCPEYIYPWTLSRLSTDSMDNVQGVHGHCPGRQWTMSTESMCNPHYITPWTFSRVWAPWTLSREFNPWTLSRISTDSMDNVQGLHGYCPGSPWIQWTFYRRARTSGSANIFR